MCFITRITFFMYDVLTNTLSKHMGVHACERSAVVFMAVFAVCALRRTHTIAVHAHTCIRHKWRMSQSMYVHVHVLDVCSLYTYLCGRACTCKYAFVHV
jgi:hypothetical protein